MSKGLDTAKTMLDRVRSIRNEIEQLVRENKSIKNKSGQFGVLTPEDNDALGRALIALDEINADFSLGLMDRKHEPEVMAKYKALITKKAQSKKS